MWIFTVIPIVGDIRRLELRFQSKNHLINNRQIQSRDAVSKCLVLLFLSMTLRLVNRAAL